MLLGLLGTAALVTIITVPAVLLNKGSKFETSEKDKTVGDQNLVLFNHIEENEGFCWGLGPVHQVLAEASLELPLVLSVAARFTSRGLQCLGYENLEAATFYV